MLSHQQLPHSWEGYGIDVTVWGRNCQWTVIVSCGKQMLQLKFKSQNAKNVFRTWFFRHFQNMELRSCSSLCRNLWHSRGRCSIEIQVWHPLYLLWHDWHQWHGQSNSFGICWAPNLNEFASPDAVSGQFEYLSDSFSNPLGNSVQEHT